MIKRLLGAGLLALAMVGTAMAENAILNGTVTYLDRRALPPGAQMEVRLVDVSLADVKATLISAQRLSMRGVPAPFALHYDSALIDEAMSYAVQAEIYLDRKVIYRTTQHVPALTRGAPETVEVVVTMARAETPSLEGTAWVVTELDGQTIDAARPPTVTFAEDGRVGIFSGCNRLAGGVEIAGNSMAFSPNMAGTMMACPEAESLLEQQMIEALQTIALFERSGADLTLKSADQAVVMKLVPAG